MALDVEPPEPPDLDTDVDASDYEDADVGGTDFRREELEEFLQAGAWAQGFERWAADADVDEDEWAVVTDLSLLEQFDFFWDAVAGRVGYHAPGLPEDWRERDLHPELDSWGTVSAINAGMTELGRSVADALEEDYLDWESDYEEPDDLPDF